MLYYSNVDETEIYAINDVSELSFLPAGVIPITIEERDRILETLKPPVTGDTVRVDRDGRIESTQWVVQRHRDEIEAGRNPTLSADHYVEIQTYRQALRNVPEQVGFPLSVDWPVKPAWFNY